MWVVLVMSSALLSLGSENASPVLAAGVCTICEMCAPLGSKWQGVFPPPPFTMVEDQPCISELCRERESCQGGLAANGTRIRGFGRFASYTELYNSVSTASRAKLAALVAANPGTLYYNAERKAVQVFYCRGLIGHIPLRADQET
jgi:hypothetical protein